MVENIHQWIPAEINTEYKLINQFNTFDSSSILSMWQHVVSVLVSITPDFIELTMADEGMEAYFEVLSLLLVAFMLLSLAHQTSSNAEALRRAGAGEDHIVTAQEMKNTSLTELTHSSPHLYTRVPMKPNATSTPLNEQEVKYQKDTLHI